jgi:hypothetical protein
MNEKQDPFSQETQKSEQTPSEYEGLPQKSH